MNNMSDKMIDLFSRQISHELHNHQVYRYFGNRLCNIGLNKIGTFMKNQANGEIGHQEKLIAYCENRNIDVNFISIDSVDLKYSTILDIAKTVLEIEQNTTKMLKEMVEQALEDSDFLTYEWLMKDLILEQIEEEAIGQSLVDMLTNVGDSMMMIQLFDNTFSL